MTVIDRFVQAVSHGGQMHPTLQVVHSAETPLRAGYAKSIAENWFGKSATTSAHFMVDPVELIRMLSDNVVAYAVGPKANGFTLNWEQAGYARLSRAEWTTPDGMAQMNRLAAGLRERGEANGIPLRWATDDDIRAAARGVPGGICFHDDIRRVLGGTTHVDPMPNYPRDLLMARVQSATTISEDDMPLTIADLKAIRAFVWEDLLTDGKTVPIGVLQDVQRALRDPITSKVPGAESVVITPRDMLGLIDAATYATAREVGALKERPAVDIDEQELAVALAPALAGSVSAVLERMSDEDVKRVAEAAADVADERARKRLDTPTA